MLAPSKALIDAKQQGRAEGAFEVELEILPKMVEPFIKKLKSSEDGRIIGAGERARNIACIESRLCGTWSFITRKRQCRLQSLLEVCVNVVEHFIKGHNTSESGWATEAGEMTGNGAKRWPTYQVELL
jgi:hypothetical protein